MTTQEQQLIDELVERIRTTEVQNKDEEADQRLQQGLAGTPNALYILAQTVIVQKYGLDQAQARLQAMQAELDSLHDQAAQAKPQGGSFLSHLFGGGSQSAPVPASSPNSNTGGGWQPVNNPGYPQAAPLPPASPGYGQPVWAAAPAGGGGFLQGALQTAAGVAMGEMAFQSVESLFRGFGGGGGYGRGFEGGQPSETIINNYNDDDDRERSGREEGTRDRDDSSFYNPQDDASRENDRQDFAGNSQGDGDDSTYDDGSSDNDTSGYDNTDDSGYDGDSGSFGDDGNS